MNGDDVQNHVKKSPTDIAAFGCLFGVVVEIGLCLGGVVLWKAFDEPVFGLLLIAASVFLPILGLLWGGRLIRNKGAGS